MTTKEYRIPEYQLRQVGETNLKLNLHYTENRPTTKIELAVLAYKLLGLTWNISGRDINLAQLGWSFNYNSRKRALGLCSARERKIYLSAWLVEQNLENSMQLENTIRHELAHALDFVHRGQMDHSYRWVRIARQVLCSGDRCYTEKQIQVVEKTKYTLTCPKCKEERPSHRAKKRKSACGSCCKKYNYGQYSPDFVLIQTQNF